MPTITKALRILNALILRVYFAESCYDCKQFLARSNTIIFSTLLLRTISNNFHMLTLFTGIWKSAPAPLFPMVLN